MRRLSREPRDRRSLCYDRPALNRGSAVEAATEMGIELLTEDEYLQLQQLGEFNTKTSSRLKTPEPAHHYYLVFVYYNGAGSYYAARGFRGLLRV